MWQLGGVSCTPLLVRPATRAAACCLPLLACIAQHRSASALIHPCHSQRQQRPGWTLAPTRVMAISRRLKPSVTASTFWVEPLEPSAPDSEPSGRKGWRYSSK